MRLQSLAADISRHNVRIRPVPIATIIKQAVGVEHDATLSVPGCVPGNIFWYLDPRTIRPPVYRSGRRPTKAMRSCLVDLDSQETVVRVLAKSHSLRVNEGMVWLLEQGPDRLVIADLARG